MKFNELLEEVKFGNEDYRKLKNLEKIQESYSEKNKISFLLENSMEKLDEASQVMNSLHKAYTQIRSYEQKKSLVSELKESFIRMKFDAIKKSYYDLIESINENEISNKELLSNAVALVKYSFEELNENINIKVNFPETPLSEDIDKEFDFIKKNI